MKTRDVFTAIWISAAVIIGVGLYVSENYGQSACWLLLAVFVLQVEILTTKD